MPWNNWKERKEMGAHPLQAVGIAVFLLGFTALAVGLGWGGILYYAAAVLLVAVSIAILVKCKPLENMESGENWSVIPIGIIVTFLGFIISLLSLTLASSVTGRLTLVLLGIAVSLFGILGLLNRAFMKKAIWKKGWSGMKASKRFQLVCPLVLLIAILCCVPLSWAQAPATTRLRAPHHRFRLHS
jgi:Kef-type K+ transport system membrane component KefB